MPTNLPEPSRPNLSCPYHCIDKKINTPQGLKRCPQCTSLLNDNITFILCLILIFVLFVIAGADLP